MAYSNAPVGLSLQNACLMRCMNCMTVYTDNAAHICPAMTVQDAFQRLVTTNHVNYSGISPGVAGIVSSNAEKKKDKRLLLLRRT